MNTGSLGIETRTRCLPTPDLGPLVPARHRDKAAPFLKGPLPQEAGEQFLAHRVDDVAPDLPGPPRGPVDRLAVDHQDEAPTAQLGEQLAVLIAPDDRHRIGRPRLVATLQRVGGRPLRILPVERGSLAVFLPVLLELVAAAHCYGCDAQGGGSFPGRSSRPATSSRGDRVPAFNACDIRNRMSCIRTKRLSERFFVQAKSTVRGCLYSCSMAIPQARN